MSLLFEGPSGSCERRWIVYALLRDNVQHHLEKGRPGGAFSNLHKVAEALGGQPVEMSAAGLRTELEKSKVLVKRPIEDLAISARTRAVISLRWPPPDTEETALASDIVESIPMLTGNEETLGDVFGGLVDELLSLSQGASADAVVRVTDL